MHDPENPRDQFDGNIKESARKVPPGALVDYLANDEVEYRLYFDELSAGQNDLTMQYLAFDEAQQRLIDLRDEILMFTKSWTQNYIWQRDSFNLQPCEPTTKVIPGRESLAGPEPGLSYPRVPHLVGRTSFGDNIEDEWFVVWLLLAITRRFPGTTGHVVDVDGQFLLVEAAEVVPRFFKPEAALHNVYIRNGTFHILGPKKRMGKPAETGGDDQAIPSASHPQTGNFLKPELSLSMAQRGEGRLVEPHHTRINTVLLSRLKDYPDKIKAENLHTARVMMPLRAAHVLRLRPQLLPLIVQALRERDFDDVGVAASMKVFGGVPAVAMRVRFTKCLYAQVDLEDYYPPAALSRVLPMHPRNITDERPVASLLGAKLAVGLEILYHQELERGAQNIEDQLSMNQTLSSLPACDVLERQLYGFGAPNVHKALGVLDNDTEWQTYRRMLRDHGYFGALTSRNMDAYAERDARARIAFIRRQRHLLAAREKNRTELELRFPTYSLIRSAMIECQPKVSQYQHFDQLEADDPEDWTDVRAEELRAVMQARFDAEAAQKEMLLGQAGHALGDLASATREKQKNMSTLERIERYITKEKSPYDGLEAPVERLRFEGHGPGPDDGLAPDDEDLFSMKDMMQALDEQVRHEINRTRYDDEVDDEGNDETRAGTDGDDSRGSNEDARVRPPKLRLPSVEESSMWSQTGASSDAGEVSRETMEAYMEVMDKQIKAQPNLRSFETHRPGELPPEDWKTDVHYNLAKSWMASAAEAGGGHNPVSSIAGPLGLGTEFRPIDDHREGNETKLLALKDLDGAFL
eukprot:CAMPEP_0167776700 /NCGR_PEP_ID=MMETSP0111_2-20121227/3271_1 /TAXON_ID=91324 /ORGANISM="Lotharella globosa, Strain CCCM811" /LENGTH=806 /DNA_ID=CAMNT_0007666777 /DNA_START=151 /DNA_END=2571 /DNA_ORIENTATION=+